MKELLDKLSSYNLFNYLWPGVLFAAIASRVTSYSLLDGNIATALVTYYFIGLVVSRLGSLILEPAFRRTRFVTFGNYGDFLQAAKLDEKVELMSEVNNMYRTLCSLFGALLVLMIYERIERNHPALTGFSNWLGVVLLMLLFALSYRKQTSYVASRVAEVIKEKPLKKD